MIAPLLLEGASAIIMVSLLVDEGASPPMMMASLLVEEGASAIMIVSLEDDG